MCRMGFLFLDIERPEEFCASHVLHMLFQRLLWPVAHCRTAGVQVAGAILHSAHRLCKTTLPLAWQSANLQKVEGQTQLHGHIDVTAHLLTNTWHSASQHAF